MSEPLVCLTTHSLFEEIGCYSYIMISISCGPLQIPFFCTLITTLLYFFISTSSVISLIKRERNCDRMGCSKGQVQKNDIQGICCIRENLDTHWVQAQSIQAGESDDQRLWRIRSIKKCHHAIIPLIIFPMLYVVHISNIFCYYCQSFYGFISY